VPKTTARARREEPRREREEERRERERERRETCAVYRVTV